MTGHAALPRERLERPYNDFQQPQLPERPTLVLCTSAGEVARLAEAGGYDALIATTPQAACECELRELGYHALEDFFDVTAYLEADEPMLALQAGWADHVDEYAWEALPELRAFGLRPAGHYVFFLKVLIDTLYRASFELAHLLHAAGPARMVYTDAPSAGLVPETLFFPRPVHVDVLPFLAEVYGCELVPTPVPDVPDRAPEALGSAAKLERFLSPRTVARLRALKHGGAAGLVPAFVRPGGRPEIVCGRGYDVDRVASRLGADGYRVAPLVEPLRLALGVGERGSSSRRMALAELWPWLRSEQFLWEPFTWAGADLRALADARLERWWTGVVPAMWEALVRSRSRFERDRPRAVLVYSPWSPQDHGALQGARSLGVPTITYQHGGFEGNCEYTTYDLTDLRFADYRLVYGEGTAGYFRERTARIDEPRAALVAIGSARLDALRSAPPRAAGLDKRLDVPPGRPVVLYLPANYQQTNWYLCRGAYSAVSYYRLLTKVVELLGRFPDVSVLYKPFPGRTPDPVVELIGRGAPNVSVVPGIPVTELFAMSDACVLDIPSTALLEALLTPKPLLTFADRRFVTLRPDARSLLRRRTSVSESPEEFLAELAAFLAAGSFDELVDPDDAFLRAYGTHLDDGRSAERAVRAVLEIAAAHEERVQGRR